MPALGLYGLLLHSDVRWRFGPLAYLVATPAFHRWHHANADVPEGGCNFAGLFPLWDMAFGTFHLPAEAPEMPAQTEVGLDGGITVVDFETPQSVALFGQSGIERDSEDFFAAYILNEILGGSGRQSRLMEEVREATERASAVTRQLLAFARKQAIAPEIIDLNETVGSMLKMLGRLLGEDLELVWMPAPEPVKVLLDSSQLDQVLALRDGRVVLVVRAEPSVDRLLQPQVDRLVVLLQLEMGVGDLQLGQDARRSAAERVVGLLPRGHDVGRGADHDTDAEDHLEDHFLGLALAEEVGPRLQPVIGPRDHRREGGGLSGPG